MTNHNQIGYELRKKAKDLVFDFMKSTHLSSLSDAGMRTSEIFRECGFDWGEYKNATSSNQQYWLVALLRELEKEGKVQRDPNTKLWSLK